MPIKPTNKTLTLKHTAENRLLRGKTKSPGKPGPAKFAPSIEEMKAAAKALRAQTPDHVALSHCKALDIIARRFGFANWQTARARARTIGSITDMRIGARVSGRYLGIAFTGELRQLTKLGKDAFQVSIQCQKPIDVIRFQSFSSLRRRINATIDRHGVSFAVLSSGEPQLILGMGKTQGARS